MQRQERKRKQKKIGNINWEVKYGRERSKLKGNEKDFKDFQNNGWIMMIRSRIQ